MIEFRRNSKGSALPKHLRGKVFTYLSSNLSSIKTHPNQGRSDRGLPLILQKPVPLMYPKKPKKPKFDYEGFYITIILWSVLACALLSQLSFLYMFVLPFFMLYSIYRIKKHRKAIKPYRDYKQRRRKERRRRKKIDEKLT